MKKSKNTSWSSSSWDLDKSSRWLLDGGSLPADQILYLGERGGRYYKRTRADGTTYRDYTY